ncbi:hypothetical protein TrCOL_g8862 [Triparma columacea]|uniref:Methyltransferase domain-containing protein n=1 Tax=Triparma columacea TaxID=722753 RepID=A0A9W7LAT7_9STRA|nr:hypothetical protein TrCOL_g8862 [Triparma columacea]
MFATAATKGALKILSPAPSSLHYTTPMNPPLIDLLINVNIDLEDFQSFAQARGRDFAGVFVIVELDKLDSTVDGVYEEVGRVEVKEAKVDVDANIAKILPGKRSLRCSLVTAAGDVYDSTVVDFEVKDREGTGRGSNVDINSWNSLGVEVGSEGYEDYFSQVYRYKVWSDRGKLGSDSGPGSNLEVTNGVRRAILDVLDTNTVSRIVDVPCGDMTWMVELLPVLKDRGIRYLGIDVVSHLVEEHTAAYTNGEFKGTAEFRRLDLTKEELPDIFPGDLIICRHLMFHLPMHDNLQIIEKLGGSAANRLMLTTYLRADENERDFVLAMGHKVNLFRPPYCIKDPSRLVFDEQEDMYTGIWDLDGTTLLGESCQGNGQR